MTLWRRFLAWLDLGDSERLRRHVVAAEIRQEMEQHPVERQEYTPYRRTTPRPVTSNYWRVQ